MRRSIRWPRVRLALAVFLAIGMVIQPVSGEAKTASPTVELKVALLPIFDVLPFYVAQDEGFFEAGSIRITALPVGSALERDQLLQAGEIDGVVNEMTTVANFNRQQARVKIVGVARGAVPGFPLFRFLAAPGSGFSSPADLAGVPIGISRNTIIEYVTDRLLTASGLEPEQIVKRSVPVIPERYQLLMQGQIKAAVIPDPLAKSAVEAGAVEVLDDTAAPRYSMSVVTFTRKALEEKAGAVRLFLSGWDRAVERINASPDAYRALLLRKIRVPKNIQETFSIPPFQRSMVPDAGQWDDVQDWMVKNGLLDRPVPYGDCVTADYLPEH